MTASADTEWEPWGQGSRRIYCGVVCLTISVSGDGRRVPEVRTRQRGQGMVAAHGDTMTEADARAWCERWARGRASEGSRRVTVRLTAEEHAILAADAEREGVTLSEHVRRLITPK